MSDPQQPAGLAVVIDTNFLLAHLPWLSLMSKAANQVSQLRGEVCLHILRRTDVEGGCTQFQITLIVPWVVITELDSLKGRLRCQEMGEGGRMVQSAIRGRSRKRRG
eukprot:3285982-Rhodomonas_salina.1